jgi:Holliday junction resolvase RusA-like endonuclease
VSTLNFFARGLPKGQPRARAFARKMGGNYVARMYDGGTADDWKESVWIGLREQLLKTPFQRTEGPVHVALVFLMPRPKSHYGAKGLKDSAPRYHTGKPDIDNLCKLVFDVVTKTETIWHDDSQIIACIAEKRYAAPNEHSGCVVTISTDCTDALVLPSYRLQKEQA